MLECRCFLLESCDASHILKEKLQNSPVCSTQTYRAEQCLSTCAVWAGRTSSTMLPQPYSSGAPREQLKTNRFAGCGFKSTLYCKIYSTLQNSFLHTQGIRPATARRALSVTPLESWTILAIFAFPHPRHNSTFIQLVTRLAVKNCSANCWKNWISPHLNFFWWGHWAALAFCSAALRRSGRLPDFVSIRGGGFGHHFNSKSGIQADTQQFLQRAQLLPNITQLRWASTHLWVYYLTCMLTRESTAIKRCTA